MLIGLLLCCSSLRPRPGRIGCSLLQHRLATTVGDHTAHDSNNNTDPYRSYPAIIACRISPALSAVPPYLLAASVPPRSPAKAKDETTLASARHPNSLHSTTAHAHVIELHAASDAARHPHRPRTPTPPIRNPQSPLLPACQLVHSGRLSACIASSPLQHEMSPPRMYPPCKPKATTSGRNTNNRPISI